MTHVLAVDLGGTHCRAAVVSASGTVESAAREPVQDASLEGVLTLVVELVRQLDPQGAISLLGMGVAAHLRVPQGYVKLAPNLGWRDVPLQDLLEERLRRRVRLANDVNAIAYGEAVAGAARGTRHSVSVFVGTGVGMGAVVNGVLLEGKGGLAAEIGHVKVSSPERGRPCGCGERGCLEAYTSGRHLPQLWREIGGKDVGELSATTLQTLFETGDMHARALLSAIGEYLGTAVGNVVTLLDPEVLVLGGGVLQAAPSLWSMAEARVAVYAGRPQQEGFRIARAELGDDAGLVGAGLLALAPLAEASSG